MVPKSTRRRVWNCIPFGYELPMLLLHMRTVQSVVDSFLITESTTTHTTTSTKPLVLRDALRNGSVPTGLSRMISVRTVDYQQGRSRYCRAGKWQNNPPRCFEAFHRFALVEMLLERAAPEDVAIFGDVDEIPKPEAISLLAQCYPFEQSPPPPFVILRLSLFK